MYLADSLLSRYHHPISRHPHKANNRLDTSDKQFTSGKILLTHNVNSKKVIHYTTLAGTLSPVSIGCAHSPGVEYVRIQRFKQVIIHYNLTSLQVAVVSSSDYPLLPYKTHHILHVHGMRKHIYGLHSNNSIFL